jgi:anti-anti-sigma regulatory factor
MLRISVVESPRRCLLVVEGKLIAPWTAELATAYEKARANLHGRELVLDLRSLTTISAEGEKVLLQLMNEQVKFRCGVFMKEVLRRLMSTSR